MLDLIKKFLISKLFPWLVEKLTPLLKKSLQKIFDHYLKVIMDKLTASIFRKDKTASQDYEKKAKEQERKAEKADAENDKEAAARARGAAEAYREAASQFSEDLRKFKEEMDETIRKTMVDVATAVRRTDVSLDGSETVTVNTPPLSNDGGKPVPASSVTLSLPR